MAVVDRAAVVPAVANPAALGLGGFALTTFVLSTHNAGLAPDLTWVGLAFFYGGPPRFSARLWEVQTGKTFWGPGVSPYRRVLLALPAVCVLLLPGQISHAGLGNYLR